MSDDFLEQKQLCQRFRKLARKNKVTFDFNMHDSKLNLHLVKYLEYCGVDIEEYLTAYLSNLQPFMITELKEQEKFEGAVCILDNYYRISVYIKANLKKGEELIVSFHENHKKGIARSNSLIQRNDYVYVFADSIESKVEDIYTINLFITRGLRNFPINVAASKYDDDGFLIRYQAISNALLEICNRYLEDLYTSDLDFSQIHLFSSLQQLSFTSYGKDVLSNISLLIDSIIIQKDYLSKQISCSMLSIYCSSLNLLENNKKEILEILKERYAVNSAKIVNQILEDIQLDFNLLDEKL